MSQNGVKSETRELAQQLVAFEAGLQSVSLDGGVVTCGVCEKLRRTLVTLTGVAGFSSLLSRALTLAVREVPALSAVQVNPDGSLQGLGGEAARAQPVLVAYLLSLLITFIGQALTMQLLHDIWPDLPGPGLNSVGKESK
jgi:hypothetical protein